MDIFVQRDCIKKSALTVAMQTLTNIGDDEFREWIKNIIYLYLIDISSHSQLFSFR